MGLKQFRIEFTYPGSSVFASQTLHGKVVLEVSQDKVINSLEILCSGKGKVEWKETPRSQGDSGDLSKKLLKPGENGKTKMTSSTPLNSQTIMSVEENYFEERIFLLDETTKESPDKLLTVGKGCHEYPFAFRIPSSSPSSFQGPYGDVKYFLEARLSRPRQKKDHVIKIPFTVNGLLDLNKDPRLGNPRVPPPDYGTELKKLSKSGANFLPCFICWINKDRRSLLNQVGFHLRLHKSLFVPGEYIQFVADMRNMSPTDVSGVTLSLIQETNYFVGDKCRSGLKHTVATAKGPSVTSGQQEIWETNPLDSLFLQIPAVPPTNLGCSKIIEVKYFLQLEMVFYGQKNIKGQLPILIGNIPLRSVFRDFVNLKKRNGTSEVTPGEDNGGICPKPFGLSLGYPDLPSPTFEEGVCFTPSHLGNGVSCGPYGVPVTKTPPPDPKTRKTSMDKETGDFMDNGEDEEVDSDEEYLRANKEGKGNKKYDDNYVPLYAKYPTTYACDG